ncbi:YjgN family protein [Pseudogulbenkiania sp. MAI-1]|uniref:YjgN family protein n=1 Tax=Pseudogulbenkiania sp. MAI-1 TaxID=990370 RepID=UPI00045E791F|nr:YjgN family protein [Pseudogulbenkiania sp. MAI-1]
MYTTPQDTTPFAPLENPPPATPPTPDVLRFSFSGETGAFFRIWIVNLLLSIVTLGIYSAWGKVRTLKYLYGHTRLAGASFDYHGKPLAILKGRLLIVAVLVALALADRLTPGLSALLYLVLLPLLPWVVVTAMTFRLRNTSWRQMRFDFRARGWDAAGPYLGGLLISVLTLGLALPYVRHWQQQFLVNHARFGGARFEMENCVGRYYRVVLKGLLCALLGFVLVGVILGLTSGILAGGMDRDAMTNMPGMLWLIVAGVVLYLFFLLMWLAIGQVIGDRLANEVWNHTVLEHDGRRHRFESTMTLRQLFKLHLGNAFLTLISLGLLYPYARLRALRYRLEHLAMYPADDLADLRSSPAAGRTALGDAAVDGFELDLGL